MQEGETGEDPIHGHSLWWRGDRGMEEGIGADPIHGHHVGGVTAGDPIHGHSLGGGDGVEIGGDPIHGHCQRGRGDRGLS